MSYKIKEDISPKVEIREIEVGDFFEFDNDVYQRFSVAANFNVVAKVYHAGEYPIFAVCLSNNSIVFFGTTTVTKVTRLYEVSPVVLSRVKL